MSTIRLYLKANEKIFINGAVLQVDRKVAFDLLNDATFLLETHVMQRDAADTPLKQLYFVIQLMMMHPGDREQSMNLFEIMVRNLKDSLETQELIEGVKQAEQDVQSGKDFNALKIIRGLFSIEESILEMRKPITASKDHTIPLAPEAAGMQLRQA